MKELRILLEDNGFENVQTYIQSGNIVFTKTERTCGDIGKLIQNKFGFTPDVLVLSDNEFIKAVENNPYPEFEGKSVHFYFCKESPKPDTDKIEKLAANTERYELVGNVFYLHAPDGIARSKLVAGIERCLGVSATGRNLNTINKLKEMVSRN